MSLDEQLFFKEYLSQSQLEECQEIQKKDPQKSLFIIAIEKGYINDKNLPYILKKAPEKSEKEKKSPKKRKLFGELCLEKGYVTSKELKECLATQDKLKKVDKHFRLGQILIERKCMSTRQAQHILELQGKKIMRCIPCDTKYNIRNYRADKKYKCPKCQSTLTTSGPSVSLGAEKHSLVLKDTIEMDDEAPSLLNKKVGDYEIVAFLGEGGMADVYKVVNRHHRRPRALKIMKQQAGAERFNREFESAHNLRHPHIIRVYETGQLEGRPYFFMEYLDGGTLTNRIEKFGIIPLKEGLSILKQIVIGLKYAHENNIVHRDIKPSNILITRGSKNELIVKITDFGIARAPTQSHITMTGQMVGTFKYMAPEHIQGMGVDGKNDIFSLGIMAYEIFTGKAPFVIDDSADQVAYLFKNLKENPPPLNQLNPDLPKELNAVIQNMLYKEPKSRYDAVSLLKDIDRFSQFLQKKTRLATDDKTSAFYDKSRLVMVKDILDKISKRFRGVSPSDMEPSKEPIVKITLDPEDLDQLIQTEEIVKEDAAKQQYELGISLYKKGNFDRAINQLQALVEVFPGSTWSRDAKKKIKAIKKKRKDSDNNKTGSVKKKITVIKKLSEGQIETTSLVDITGKKRGDTKRRSKYEIQLEMSPPIPEDISHPQLAISDTVDKKAHKTRRLRLVEKSPALTQIRFREDATKENKTWKKTTSLTQRKKRIIRDPQELLVSVKPFIDTVKTLEEYERKQNWLDDVFLELTQIKWEHTAEEVSEILYKWGRFLMDHGKTQEGLRRFWEIYEKFKNTRWYMPVFEELVAIEQPESMVFIESGDMVIKEKNSNNEEKLVPYFIDITPVTNAQYLEFIKNTNYPPPQHWLGGIYPIGKGYHPVVWISAKDAQAYASWRDKRLPKESEWEKAARGSQNFQWPWGNEYESKKCNCQEAGIGDTTQVKQYPGGKSDFGCYDMSGNVWEWTESWYAENNKSHQVLRGGSWYSYEEFTSSTYRNYDAPKAKSGLYGFRCAKSFGRS